MEMPTIDAVLADGAVGDCWGLSAHYLRGDGDDEHHDDVEEVLGVLYDALFAGRVPLFRQELEEIFPGVRFRWELSSYCLRYWFHVD